MSGSYRLRWLPEAVSDLARLRAFIHVHDPDAAGRAAARILEAVQKVVMFPFIGRPAQNIKSPHFRDLFIPYGQAGYWLRYAVTENEIFIVRIWHGRENR